VQKTTGIRESREQHEKLSVGNENQGKTNVAMSRVVYANKTPWDTKRFVCQRVAITFPGEQQKLTRFFLGWTFCPACLI